MKKAFSTVACASLDWRQVLQCAVEADMKGVEVRLDGAGRAFGLDDSQIGEMCHAFETAGIALTDLGTSVRISDFDDGAMLNAVRAVELAAQCGAKAIRIFPGSFVKRFSDKTPHSIPGMVRFLRQLGDYAADKQVEIWVETHNEFSTGRDMSALLNEVGKPNVKAIWDIIHSIECGETPSETICALGNHIAHVHIKDGKKRDDPDLIDYLYTELGKGDLPIRSIVTLLEVAGYRGFYSLEWETLWRPEIQSVYSNLPALLKVWADFDFRRNNT